MSGKIAGLIGTGKEVNKRSQFAPNKRSFQGSKKPEWSNKQNEKPSGVKRFNRSHSAARVEPTRPRRDATPTGLPLNFIPRQQFDSINFREAEFIELAKEEVHPTKERKFSSFSRLYIGNVPRDTTEQDIRDLFQEFCGADEKPEVFLDTSKGFGFVKLPYRHQALAAKHKLDNSPLKNRSIRVRFGKHNAGLLVRNLGPCVTNETLYRGFRKFGEIEKAVVVVDEQGRSTGIGKVYFVNKNRSLDAMSSVNNQVFIMGSAYRPIICEELQHYDEEDGLPEAFISRSHAFQDETRVIPHFAYPGTTEFMIAENQKKLLVKHLSAKQELKRKYQKEAGEMEHLLHEALQEIEMERRREDMEKQKKALEMITKRMDSIIGHGPTKKEGQDEPMDVSEPMDENERSHSPRFTNMRNIAGFF